LRRKSVTLSLLWVEYRQAHPDGYGYSQFCHNYNKWAKQLKPMMRQRHWAGEKLFIDYAGQTVPVVDAQTGEVRDVEIFVAVLGPATTPTPKRTNRRRWPTGSAPMCGRSPSWACPRCWCRTISRPGSRAHRYEPDLNPSYQEFARHYDVAVVPARVRKPKDKAKVESGVQVVERWILARLRDHTFFSLAELNRAIRSCWRN
jgi:transposase